MAVTKKLAKLLVILGGAVLGTASLLVGCVKADSGTASPATQGESSPQEAPAILYGPPPRDLGAAPDDLETLRNAADSEPIINLYGVLAPWEIEELEEQEKRLEEERREREEAGKRPPIPLYGPSGPSLN